MMKSEKWQKDVTIDQEQEEEQMEVVKDGRQ